MFHSHIEGDEALVNGPGLGQCFIIEYSSSSIVYNYPESRRGVAGEDGHCGVVVYYQTFHCCAGVSRVAKRV